MDLSRRRFIQLAAATGAVALATPISLQHSLTPILWGDGEHDDGPALRALLSGKPIEIRAPEGVVVIDGKRLIIQGGHFYIGDDSSLFVYEITDKYEHITITHCHFRTKCNPLVLS